MVRNTCLFAFVFAFSSTVALAHELGNINFPDAPETDEESREASAAALDGLARIFSALSSRETRQSNGSEALIAASASLDFASSRILEIVERGVVPEVSLEFFSDTTELSAIDPRILSELRSLEEMYVRFAERIGHLSSLVAKQAGTPVGERIFGDINLVLNDILPLGNVISLINEKLRQQGS